MPHRQSLAALTFRHSSPGRIIADNNGSLRVDDLRGGSCFADGDQERMRGRSVLLATQSQLPTVLATVALDGIARRIIMCTPDLVRHLPSIVREAEVDFLVCDRQDPELIALGVPLIHGYDSVVSEICPDTVRDNKTEWVLLTSGTTGRPKMIAHTLASLAGPLDDGVMVPDGAVWSTFYDIRRYGGLQILLRSLIGGGSLILSSTCESVGDLLGRLGTAGVTHISGTPSHWRRALTSSQGRAISPAYVRLSGEVADQAILDRLRSHYPNAGVAHAFASTEAGVGFDVRDGLAGFPASFIPHPNGNPSIELKVENDTLRIRSSRIATRCIGGQLHQTDGFIDTGDLIEQRGERYYFMGRREGVINVGGQKVYPEEVENVITQHPAVLMARVWPRRSPVTGSVVAADVVLRPASVAGSFDGIVVSLREGCQQALAPYKVPVTWRQVDDIDMTAAGKVPRS